MNCVEINNKKCCFIGHRKIAITENLKEKLTKIIDSLILSHNVSEFLFGSKSDFNDFCHTIVTNLKTKYPEIKRIAYTCKSESAILECEREKFEKVYASVKGEKRSFLGFESEVDFKSKYVSGKASYIERNQSMIDDSDFCIFYYDENYLPQGSKKSNSGTAIAYKYAKQKNKVIFNVY